MHIALNIMLIVGVIFIWVPIAGVMAAAFAVFGCVGGAYIGGKMYADAATWINEKEPLILSMPTRKESMRNEDEKSSVLQEMIWYGALAKNMFFGLLFVIAFPLCVAAGLVLGTGAGAGVGIMYALKPLKGLDISGSDSDPGDKLNLWRD